MGLTAIFAEDKDASKKTITFVDKSEGEERKQIRNLLCILVTLQRPMCA